MNIGHIISNNTIIIKFSGNFFYNNYNKIMSNRCDNGFCLCLY